MTSPELPHRARRGWPWVAALVALAITVPVVVTVARDLPGTGGRGDVATTVAAPTAGPPESDSESNSESDSGSMEAVPSRTVERGPTRALFFGDSYFIGGGYTGEDNSMARLASNRLGWSSEINGGGGTGFVATNYDYGLGNYLEQIDQGAFDVGARRWVVLEGGNNDRGQSLDDIRRNARKVVRIAQRTFPNAKVVLVGPLDVDSDHGDLVPIIKVLRKVAQRRSIPYVNAKNWLAGHYDLVGPDLLHPYPEGHRLLGRKLAKALRARGA